MYRDAHGGISPDGSPGIAMGTVGVGLARSTDNHELGFEVQIRRGGDEIDVGAHGARDAQPEDAVLQQDRLRLRVARAGREGADGEIHADTEPELQLHLT